MVGFQMRGDLRAAKTGIWHTGKYRRFIRLGMRISGADTRRPAPRGRIPSLIDARIVALSEQHGIGGGIPRESSEGADWIRHLISDEVGASSHAMKLEGGYLLR